jgi:hypothetical protein
MAEIDIARKVVEAWEALPGGRNYSMKVVESWLSVHMAPMVNEMRSLVGAGPSTSPSDLSPAAPTELSVGPADQIIGQIEELFPNWRSCRDLIDCIECTLHELRKDAGREA